jgi:hypothetical protein
LQAPQRGFGGAQDVVLAQVFAFAHVGADFGGDDDLRALAAALEPVADDCFRLAAGVAGDPARIAVGAVERVETGVDETVKNGERGLLVNAPAEHIGAEHQRRDGKAGAAEGAMLHGHLDRQARQ